MPMWKQNMADKTTPVMYPTPGASPTFPAATVPVTRGLTPAHKAVTRSWSREEYKLLEELLTAHDHQNPIESRWERVNRMATDPEGVKRHYESLKEGQYPTTSHNMSELPPLEGVHESDSTARQSTGGLTLNAASGAVITGLARMSSSSMAEQETYAFPSQNTSALPALDGAHESDSSARQFTGGLTLKAASEAEQQWQKGLSWTKEEHELFLLGLKEFGKSHWKSISQKYVTTRRPTQIASHAQKYFIRLKRGKGNRRPSIHDRISLDGEGGDRLQGSQAPVTGHSSPSTMPTEVNANEGGGDVLQGCPGPIMWQASPPATPVSGQRHVHAWQPEF